MFASLLRSHTLNRVAGIAAVSLTSVSYLQHRKLSCSFCDSVSDNSAAAEWVSGYSPEGQFYFYNVKTGESTWTNPVVNVGTLADNHWYDNWDLRAPKPKQVTKSEDSADTDTDTDTDTEKEGKDKKKSKKRINHQIILIRHGEYESADADHKRVLTARGREQAVCAGKRLQELVDARAIHPIKYVYFSTMARATETHQLIQSQLTNTGTAPHNINPCSMIREGAVCPPSPPHSTWKPSDEDFEKDGKRVEAAFASHISRADPTEEESSYTTVLVCHGNIIRYFVLKALQLPVNAWLRTSVANCSISSLIVHSDGHVSLRGHGDSGHLNAKDITW